MPKYLVPFTKSLNGLIEVNTSTPEEAIVAAREKYMKLGENAVSGPEHEVDYAYGEDPQEVIPADE